ncbi:allophanate hydrolase [Paenibacillus glycanilyticus]|uniref:Allophanate hydrolase n=1 Tax=Paenibacillus glycanilyticus TaxID=126569 RepID=A0ABQ6NGU0_9BACL|nr:allophanate hydrolase [Paenibacillus glycanilyticus]GMK44301.1 allophanate hydrolase [Paenibacillus glycanilyticus]
MSEFQSVMTISWLREQYTIGTLTPSQVIQSIIDRAEADREKHIWITPPSLAYIQRYLDRLNELDMALLPLWGIPFAVKDNIDVAGMPTTAGCEEYSYLPSEHAAVVERLIHAGAIPVGKTNLDQFATGLVGTRSPYGDTHNALRPELISGGSSSGSAVAVALGQAVFSLGTDTAGSGRVPAALNNLVGLKPSVGAWPSKGVVPACESLDCVTVFAHTLEDAELVDQVVRGIQPDDPWSKEIPVGERKLPAKLLLPDGPLTFYGPFADSYRAAWEKSVNNLEALKLPVEYVDIQLFQAAAALLYEGPWVAERWSALGSFIEAHPGVTLPVTEKVLRGATKPEFDAASVFTAFHKLQGYKLAAKKLLQDAALVMPTAGGTWTREQVAADPISTNSAMGLYTNHCNLLDLSALAVPSGAAGTDLPFGITLFAASGEEGRLFQLAEAILAAQEPQPTTLVAVCGLHMRGLPLERQMLEHGAIFVREDRTSPSYKLMKLQTVPPKPGLLKLPQGGASIEVEVWEMPIATFGAFTAAIPAPLGIGKVELSEGSIVPGFICEAYGTVDAEDITSYGGWRNALATIAEAKAEAALQLD